MNFKKIKVEILGPAEILKILHNIFWKIFVMVLYLKGGLKSAFPTSKVFLIQVFVWFTYYGICLCQPLHLCLSILSHFVCTSESLSYVFFNGIFHISSHVTINHYRYLYSLKKRNPLLISRIWETLPRRTLNIGRHLLNEVENYVLPRCVTWSCPSSFGQLFPLFLKKVTPRIWNPFSEIGNP